MSLFARPITNVNAFFATGIYSALSGNFLPADGNNTVALYYDRTDQLIIHSINFERILWLDPLLNAPATSERNRLFTVAVPSIHRRLIRGEFDQDLGTQRFYAGGSVATDGIDRLTDDCEVETAQFFPNVGSNQHAGALVAGNPGFYTNTTGNMVVFETYGKAYIPRADVYAPGLMLAAFIEIDLATGYATPDASLPSVHSIAPANIYQTATRFGDSFSYRRMQFADDADSRPDSPKGLMFFWTLSEGGLITGGVERVYMRVNEWNPTGKAAAAGSPNRVHKREILLTRFFLTQDIDPPVGIGNATSGVRNYQGDALYYHPPTRTIRMLFARNDGGPRVSVVHTLTPALASLSPPTPLEAIEVNRRSRVRVMARGDLNEVIGGLDVDWTLQRVSTEGEVLITTGAPASVIVAAAKFDTNTDVLYYLGSPLTRGTHYNTTPATGTITFAGTHSPPNATGYTVDYEHRTAPLSPAHGTLLTTSSQLDQDGNAETQIEYTDDATLEGELDILIASAESQV